MCMMKNAFLFKGFFIPMVMSSFVPAAMGSISIAEVFFGDFYF